MRRARPVTIAVAVLLSACSPATSSIQGPAASQTATPGGVAVTPLETPASAIATPTPTVVAGAAPIPTTKVPARPPVATRPLPVPATSGTPVLDRASGVLQVVDNAGRPIPTMSFNLTVFIWRTTSANGTLVWLVTERRMYSNCCLPVRLNLAGGAWSVNGAVSNGSFTRWLDFRSDPGIP